MKRTILIIAFVVSNLFAGGFENLGVHSRVIGLGGAFVGVGDASYSVFYNPAGLVNLDKFEFSSTYNQLFSGIDDDLYYLTFSSTIPLWKFGKFGAGITHLKAGAWQENTFIFSYAKDIGNLGLGGSFKLLRWSSLPAPNEDGQSYLGFTFDVGLFYKIEQVLGSGVLRFGAVAQDITQPSIAINGSDDARIPMKLIGGISYYSPTYEYLFAVDAVKENENIILRFGAEFLGTKTKIYNNDAGFFIRGGYDGIINDTPFKQETLNGGFGVFFNNLKIDYAYKSHLQIVGLGGSHKISITYQF
ncbi:MAG: hypothetical protein N2043_01285 [Ignavibacterium sp.]|nr:hypothetical protein [Ignavibacterium sp.]